MESNIGNLNSQAETNIVDFFTNIIQSESNIQEACSSLVLDMKNGTLTILKLTEKLGNLLTNENLILRRGGIEILTSVLSELPQNFLNAQEIIFLVNFYCDLLLDHHSFIPIVLKALLALVKMKELPDNAASKIFMSLNLNFVCQSQPLSDRNVCYQLFNVIMCRKQTELQALGPDFVCGYLTIIDSERDPRNLMYIFENLPKFYQNFPPGHLLEDAFEAVACYFPVDFRSNPKDPRGISREDLTSMLMLCLTAIEDFCPLTVALALDKLSSDLKVAKLDSLTLLKRCCSQFPPEKLCPSINEIVTSLLEEMKPEKTEAEVQATCSETLACVLKYLSDHEKFELLTKSLNDIFSSIQHFLNDIHLSYFFSTIKFLSILSFSCRSASQFIVNKAVSQLISISKVSYSEQNIILESLKLLLSSCVKFNISDSDLTELKENWKYIPELFLSSCQSSQKDLKLLAIIGASEIVQLFNFDERHQLNSELCRNVMFDPDADIRQSSTISLCTIGKNYPDEVKTVLDKEIIIPDDVRLKERVFQLWCTFASIPGFLSYLDVCVKMYITNESQENAVLIIKSLKDIIIQEKNNINFLNNLYYEVNITRHLMDWWHEGCSLISDDVNKVFNDETVAENLLLIITIITRVLDKKSQLESAFRYCQLTTEYSKRFMNSFQYLNVNEDLSEPKVYCSLSIITFEAVVNAILSDVLTESLRTCFGQIIKYLTTLSIFCSRPICCLVACKSIAAVFNKISEGADLEDQTKYVYAYISAIISRKNGILKKNAVYLLIYTIKSLLFRGYSDMNSWFDMLLSLSVDEEISSDVADGFRVILQEDDYFLSTSNHCSIKLFYRQRLFSYMVPRLVELAKSNQSIIKINCAVSVTHLLQNIPQIVIANHFKQIIPLLIELLNVDCKMEFTHATLEKLSIMLMENAASFEQYVETFISQLLSLARNSPYMKVRISSLECLYRYSRLNPTILLPFKARVVHELTRCLDDRKRLVRREAVKTRTRWITLGSS